jgi:hypothetical protein
VSTSANAVKPSPFNSSKNTSELKEVGWPPVASLNTFHLSTAPDEAEQASMWKAASEAANHSANPIIVHRRCIALSVLFEYLETPAYGAECSQND